MTNDPPAPSSDPSPDPLDDSVESPSEKTRGASPFSGPITSATRTSDEAGTGPAVMTPELLEDEARRGDFVIRWAVVLLAFLLGCTEIAETATFVHIRSGEVIASNGGWAPATDPFSYTAADRSWINLSWLFDVIAAGGYTLFGWTGLSIGKALLAAIIFGLAVHIHRGSLPTWWTSICAVLALLVCYPQFTVEPQIVTLLGLVGMVFVLHLWREDTAPKLIWALPVIAFFWANLDPRMFLGPWMLLLYGTGEWLCTRFDRCSHLEPGRVKTLWMVIGVTLLAGLLNRFHIHTYLAPLRLYTVDYPMLREYGGELSILHDLRCHALLDSAPWVRLTHHTLAGVILLGLSAVAMFLNRSRLSLGDLFVFLGMVPLAIFAHHQLAPVALVVGIIGALNAQEWYQDRFRLTYRGDRKELLFSRGGRAATVLALFCIGFWMTSGRLDGPYGQRTGAGLDPTLAGWAMAHTEELADSFNDRPFHPTLVQGDLLIWAGQRPFADHRVHLYAGDEPNLLETQMQLNRALQPKSEDGEGTANATFWRERFDQYEITHVLPIVAPTDPESELFATLPQNPYFVLAKLGTLPQFYRNDIEADGYLEFLRGDPFNPIAEAFRPEEPVSLERIEFAEPVSGWEGFVSRPEPSVPPEAVAAHNAFFISTKLPRNEPGYYRNSVALHILAIRDGLRSVRETPSSLGFRTLGMSYRDLAVLENQQIDGHAERLIRSIQQNSRTAPQQGAQQRIAEIRQKASSAKQQINFLRQRQAAMALRQALLFDPDDATAHGWLAGTYGEMIPPHRELQLTHFEELLRIDREIDNDLLDEEQEAEVRTRTAQLREIVQNAKIEYDRQLAEQKAPRTLAYPLFGQGLVSYSGRILEPDLEEIRATQQLPLWNLWVQSLIATGRLNEAREELQAIEAIAPGEGTRNLVLLELGLGAHDRSLATILELIRQQDSNVFGLLPATIPVGARWPIARDQNARSQIDAQASGFSQSLESQLLLVALIAIETGRIEEASTALQRLLLENPQTPFFGLATFYLESIDPNGFQAYLAESQAAAREQIPGEFFVQQEMIRGYLRALEGAMRVFQPNEPREPVVAPRP